MIKGNNVDLTIDKRNVLHDVDFLIPENRITTFIGPSGSGKTSLLKCIVTLYPLFKGSITYNGTDVRSLSTKERVHALGYVFQHFSLFSNMTVLENCIHPQITVLGVPREEAVKKARALLHRFAIADLENYYPRRLSGGQQQRVALVRTLALGAQYIIFDEPTSALDPHNSVILASLFKELLKEKVTIVVSSHDMAFVRTIVDRIYYMHNGTIIEAYDAAIDTFSPDSSIGLFLSPK